MSTREGRRLLYRPFIIVALAVFCLSPLVTDAMIPKHVINRIFHIRWTDTSGKRSSGTAFTIDRGSKQYLITARHVVEGIQSGSFIEILRDEQWQNLVVNIVGIGKGDLDIAVLSAPILLSPPHPLDVSAKGLVYGQQIFFLGYPYSLDSGNEQLNRGIPIPFVKAGVVGAMKRVGDVSWFFLDADVNKGFSGGPLLFAPPGRSYVPGNQLRVAGIVTSYKTLLRPIVTREGQPARYIPESLGIGQAIDIYHALQLIDVNPVGFQLPTDEKDHNRSSFITQLAIGLPFGM